MDFLRQKFQGKNLATFDDKNSAWILTIPPVFSFIKNPQETLNTIFSLVEISKHQKISREFSMFIDHSNLKEMDMGASIALDVVAMNLRKELSMNSINSRFSGRFPQNEMLCQILKSMGITKHLNIRGAEPSEAAKHLFVRFPPHTGYCQIGSEFGGQQHREKAATHLVKYLNECLERASNFLLTDEGQSQILKWAGEIITNAEEHSGHRQWYAMRRHKILVVEVFEIRLVLQADAVLELALGVILIPLFVELLDQGHQFTRQHGAVHNLAVECGGPEGFFVAGAERIVHKHFGSFFHEIIFLEFRDHAAILGQAEAKTEGIKLFFLFRRDFRSPNVHLIRPMRILAIQRLCNRKPHEQLLSRLHIKRAITILVRWPGVNAGFISRFKIVIQPEPNPVGMI